MQLYKVKCVSDLEFIIEANSELDAIYGAQEKILEDTKIYKEFSYKVEIIEDKNCN